MYRVTLIDERGLGNVWTEEVEAPNVAEAKRIAEERISQTRARAVYAKHL